ncbi:MAG: hypothetical protein VCA34_10740, partial [Roseibacillus sp.]
MNMITVLLGATGLLLVVAVAMAFGTMNSQTDKPEVARLKAEIAALQAQEQQLAAPAPGALLPPHPTPLARAPFAVPPHTDDVPRIGA